MKAPAFFYRSNLKEEAADRSEKGKVVVMPPILFETDQISSNKHHEQGQELHLFDRSANKESNSDASSLDNDTPKFRPFHKPARSSMELHEFIKLAPGKFSENEKPAFEKSDQCLEEEKLAQKKVRRRTGSLDLVFLDKP